MLPLPVAASSQCQNRLWADVEPASWQRISPNYLTSVLPGFAVNPNSSQVQKEARNALLPFAAEWFGTRSRQMP